MCITIESEGNLVKWTLSVQLPLTDFAFHNKKSLTGLTCSANFAKCGDDLPEPDFLSWSNLISKTPDFHLSQFFGQLEFEQRAAITRP